MKVIFLFFLFSLLMANIVAQTQDFAIDTTKTKAAGRIPLLRGTKREVRKIERLINRKQKKKIKKPDTLYIKNHSLLLDTTPNKTNNLIIIKSKENIDSLLMSFEVLELKLPATGLVVLSLVDIQEKMLNNWDDYTQNLKQSYQKQAVLVAVSKDDNPIRSKFIMKFYEETAKDVDYLTAYQKAVNYLEKEYPNSGIKHFFYIGK